MVTRKNQELNVNTCQETVDGEMIPGRCNCVHESQIHIASGEPI